MSEEFSASQAAVQVMVTNYVFRLLWQFKDFVTATISNDMLSRETGESL